MGTLLYFLIPLNMLVCIYFTNKLFVIEEKKAVFLPLAGSFLSNVLLGYLEFQILSVENYETMQYFATNYMIVVSWVIYLSILSGISFRYPKKKYGNRSKILKSLTGIPLIFLTYFFLVNRYLDHITISYADGFWQYSLNITDPICMLYLAFVSLGVFMISWFYWRQYFKNEKTHRNIKILWLGVVQTMVSVGGVMYFALFTQNNSTLFLASFAISISGIFTTWIFTDFKLGKISAALAFHDIMDSMSSILIITNKNLEIVEINQEGINKLQLNKREVDGWPLYKLLRKLKIENWKPVLNYIANRKDNERHSTITKIEINNEVLYIKITIKPHFNKKTELMGYIILGTDVTEIKTQKDKIQDHTKVLERTNKELERFAYIASHDLKTPLRSVVSFLDLIERKIVKYEDNDLRDFVYLARQGASQMYHLIQDILEFSKVDKLERKSDEIDLNETLFKICHQLQPALTENKGELMISELPTIHAEKTHMQQLFSNLIENGFKYNEEATPLVKINHRLENGRHLFAVSDNGIGVEPQYFKQIFEMFKRLHTNPDHEGSGIGLSICKKIVDLYQGEIWLESKVDEGTTFFFTLTDQKN